MTRVSKRKLDNTIWEKMFTSLTYIIQSQSSTESVNLVLNGLCTRNEKISMAKRLVVQIMILNHMTKDTICNTVKVSSSTVHNQRLVLLEYPEYKNLLRKKFVDKKFYLNDHSALKAVIDFLDYLDYLGEGRRKRNNLLR